MSEGPRGGYSVLAVSALLAASQSSSSDSYVDWSEMARSVVKRRDYLIRLGLAKRKSAKKPTG